jgi:hypothetical protein
MAKLRAFQAFVSVSTWLSTLGVPAFAATVTVTFNNPTQVGNILLAARD